MKTFSTLAAIAAIFLAIVGTLFALTHVKMHFKTEKREGHGFLPSIKVQTENGSATK